MAIKLEKETEKYLVDSIKRFFAEDMDDEIGDLVSVHLRPGVNWRSRQWGAR